MNERDENRTPDAGADAGQGEVQERLDTEQEQGFFGTATDPTPNKYYTVEGVTEHGEGQPPRPDLAARASQDVPAPLPTETAETGSEQTPNP